MSDCILKHRHAHTHMHVFAPPHPTPGPGCARAANALTHRGYPRPWNQKPRYTRVSDMSVSRV